MPYEERNTLMSNKFNELIELFIAEEQDKAKALFHDIVVEKSRDIYESLLNDEEQVEEEAIDETTEEVEESDMDEELGGDAADDMIDDIEADEQGLDVAEEDDADEDIEDRVVDLEDALDELKAEFEKLMGDEEAEDEGEMDMDMDMGGDAGDDMDMDMGDEDEEKMEAFEDAEMVREYAEKAPAPVTSEQGDGSAGPVAGKNDMGGKAVDPTGEEKGASAPKAQDMGGTTKPDMKKV